MQTVRFMLSCLLLLLVCTACGMTTPSSPRVHLSQHTSLTNNVNACSLVTQDQLAQVVHAPVVELPPDESNGAPLIDTCQYALQGKSGSVNIDFYRTQDVLTARQAFAQLVPLGTAQDTQVIHTLGDQAIFVQKPFPILYVLKNNAFIAVGVVLPVDGSLHVQEEKQVAQLALQNM